MSVPWQPAAAGDVRPKRFDMVMALDGLTRLCPSVLFDWRLYAERGCPSFFHRHRGRLRVDDCELAFLKQVNHVGRVASCGAKIPFFIPFSRFFCTSNHL